MIVLRLICLTIIFAAASCSTAAAEIAFRWTVPEKLRGTGVMTVARAVKEAGRPPPTTIELRRCAAGGTWELDGAQVSPITTGSRCTFILDLHDNGQHELTLKDGGESVTANVAARDLLVVSIGDSVASGEGNPDGASFATPKWLERRCHRSMRSGAAQAALALEAASPQSAVTFLPLACSGATVTRGVLNVFRGIQPEAKLGDLPAQMAQVKELEKLRDIDALLVSVGANDIYFGAIAQFCARVPDCPHARFDPAHRSREAPSGTRTLEAVLAEALRALPDRYAMLARALDEAAVKPERVIVVEYFDPTHDERGRTCRHVLPGVDTREAEWTQSEVVGPLNAEVGKAATRYGWRVVDHVQEAFRRHGICAKAGQRWIVQIAESLLRGSGVSGPLHPNEAGHLATSTMIGPVLASTVGFESGTSAAESGGAPDGDGGIRWLQVLTGAVLGALLASALWLLRIRRHRR
jgi:hypothetical protein